MVILRKPTVLDLYSGAGGMSLGFKNAGFEIVGAVEIDGWAADTYESNFGHKVMRKRVSEVTDEEINHLKSVDVVCGGPPCQGFSIAAKGRVIENDPRNNEVFNFLNLAFKLNPKFILIENVAQFEKYYISKETLLIDELKNILARNGYKTASYILNAVNFGVPQNRQRFFLVATRLEQIPNFSKFLMPQVAGRDENKYISVKQAISDLPPVTPRMLKEDDIVRYEVSAENEYQAALRNTSGTIFNHIPMRHTPRLVERFRMIPIGANGASVWDENAPKKRGNTKSSGTKFEQNHRRMDPDLPAPTITAYMYSTCLHPFQHRNITVREAARLQSFPDSFVFKGKRTTLSNKLLERKGLLNDIGLDQLNQVGNAVPPLLAQGLATEILKVLQRV